MNALFTAPLGPNCDAASTGENTKDDKDVTNYMVDQNGGIIEFIIDENTALNYYGIGDNGYVLNGSYNNADEFNGKIIKIEEIKGD